MTLSTEFYEVLHELDETHERWQDLPDHHPKIKRLKNLAKSNESIKKRETINKSLNNKLWSEEEIHFIQTKLGIITQKEIAHSLNRSFHQVKNKVYKMRKKGLLPEKTKRIIMVTDDQGDTLEFPNTVSCANHFHVSEIVVNCMCMGTRRGLYGLHFEFVERSAVECGSTAQGNN